MTGTLTLSIVAVGVSVLTLCLLTVQLRHLRKATETSNYQFLIGRVLDTRSVLIQHPDIGEMFRNHPTLQKHFDEDNMSPAQLFWALMFFTTWENFYSQRKAGLLDDVTWTSYVNSLRTVMQTPVLEKFWGRYAGNANYRSDWASFVAALAKGEDPVDPNPPRWRRWLGLPPHP